MIRSIVMVSVLAGALAACDGKDAPPLMPPEKVTWRPAFVLDGSFVAGPEVGDEKACMVAAVQIMRALKQGVLASGPKCVRLCDGVACR